MDMDFSPYFRIRNGRIERFAAPQFAPPSDDPDPKSGVRSKDVVISPQTGVSVRLYIPRIADPITKFPVVVYIHGGAFCLGSASTNVFHDFVSSLVAESNVVAVSVDYRLAPEHLLPIAYDDSWMALQWVLSHANQNGPDPWLNDHADFRRVFLCGESAGATIAHDVAVRAGQIELPGAANIDGLLLIHPYFGVHEVDELYKFLCPTSSGGKDDPRLNPAVDPRLPGMRSNRVQFCFAEKDPLKERALAYCEALRKSEWSGEIETMETVGEGHGFHLLNPNSQNIAPLMHRLASFLNHHHHDQ